MNFKINNKNDGEQGTQGSQNIPADKETRQRSLRRDLPWSEPQEQHGILRIIFTGSSLKTRTSQHQTPITLLRGQTLQVFPLGQYCL